MKLRTATVLMAAVGALTAFAPRLDAAASADEYVIDQEQPLVLFLLARLAEPGPWQSFQQSAAVISGAGIFLFQGEGDQGPVRIELWNDTPTNGGERLAHGVSVGSQGTWVDVFWTPLAIEPGRSYLLVIDGVGAPGMALGLGGAPGTAYPNGTAYLNGVPDSRFDATFRTFGAPIPEPSAALLLLLGLATLGSLGLRRRRAAR